MASLSPPSRVRPTLRSVLDVGDEEAADAGEGVGGFPLAGLQVLHPNRLKIDVEAPAFQ